MGTAILCNLIWILLAYMIGSINFSIILTKFSSNKKNIKEVGSGNAGATNAMRAYGFKFGFLVFILDASKSFWLGFSLGVLQANVPGFESLIPQMCLIFVIIGHIFPLYFGFKGGKGAATILGMIASISLILAAIGTILFFVIVYSTKYVSLGSIVAPYILAGLSFLIPFWHHIDSTITYGPFWVSPVCLFIASAIVAMSHYQNVMRLIEGKERKTTFSSMGELNKKTKAQLNTIEEIQEKNDFIKDKEKLENAYINQTNESLIDDATKPTSL